MSLSISIKTISATLQALGLMACGGPGNEGKEAGETSGGNNDSSQLAQGGIPPTVDSPEASPAQEPLGAFVTVAPADGAVVSEIVRLEVEGHGMENAELLPANGGKPYALFTVAPDKSRAWVDFDSRTIANGEVRVVIDAYDKPPRTEGARAIRAMPARTWTINNTSISSAYPGDYPLRRDAAPLQAMIDMSDEEFRRMIDAEWPRVHALLQEYIPDNVVFNPPVPRGFEGPRASCIQDAYGSPLACQEYMRRILMLIQ